MVPQDNPDLGFPLVHTGIGVLLRPSNIEPSSLNPEFLRYNQIAGEDWKIETPVVVEPRFSGVRYNNGVVVAASRDQVSFTQTKRTLELEEVVCPYMAVRFLSIMPRNAEYRIVGLDPTARIQLPKPSSDESPSLLTGLGRMFPFDGAFPKVQARLSYGFEDRSITLYVGEQERLDEGASSELHFSAHIHRDVPSTVREEQLEYVRSILEAWQKDLEDFDLLVTGFYLESISGTKANESSAAQ